MERKMFDTPVLPRLATILAEVKSGDLVVPAFQRPFVWDDDRRLKLLDSIAQGMPIGSLLVWRTSRKDLRAHSKVGGIPIDEPRGRSEKTSYLIDGHQRISTLFGALHPGRREPLDPEQDAPRTLYYELGAQERPAFRLAPRRGQAKLQWLPLHILFDGDALFDFTQDLRQRGQRDLARQAENLANVFKDYIIPIVPLVTEELDTVTDAFVRINSQGKGMSEAHMLRALTHLGTIDTDQRFAQVRARLEPLGFGDLDPQVLVNVLKSILGLDVYGSDVRRLHDELKKDSRALDLLGDAVEEAATALVDIGVRGPAALPYAYQLVAIATFAALSPGRLALPAVRERLRRWFWVTTYTEHFTGITGSGIRDSIRELESLLSEQHPPSGLLSRVEPLSELRMPSVRGHAFLLFLAQLPASDAGKKRRQELLAADDARFIGRLFPKAATKEPANRVIATPDEMRKLRTAMESGQGLSPAEAADFGIPEAALGLLPEQDAFLNARGRFLADEERKLIESFLHQPLGAAPDAP
jgi:hypothetical protein